MALNLITRESEELRPRITVFGVGGAGGNAVNNMIEKNLEGAEFVVANTDAQALQQSRSERKLQLGVGTTQGLGAGAKPEIGASAAEESIGDIAEHLEGSHMCFITAGMGGGTGTGAAPVIARAAREMGILTVGVVTKPFQFEGTRRMRLADSGIEELQQVVDTLIIIPNQNLFRIANERTTFGEAFMMADDVLYQGVKGVTDLMVRPGLINLDFADVRAVMDEMGKAMMGTGEADGETRAIDAAEKAIANPLLDEVSLKGARGVLINITGGYDLTLFELDEAANRIRQEVDAEANIIVGSTLDPEMEGTMRVSVVATGIDAEIGEAAAPRTTERRPVTTERIVPADTPARRATSAPDATTRPVPKLSIAQSARADATPAPALATQAPSAPPSASMQAPSASASTSAQTTPPQSIRAEAPKVSAPTPPAAQPQMQSRDLFAGSAALAMDLEPEIEAEQATAPAPFIAPKAVEPGEVIADEPVASAPAAPVLAEEPRRAPVHAHEGDPTPFTVEGMKAARDTAETEKGRFGLNSLIHRMTGGSAAPRSARDNAEPTVKRQPPQADRDDRHEDMGADDEDLRMEIPAFLRRQAN